MKTNAISDTSISAFSGRSEEKHKHMETYLQNTFQSQLQTVSNEFNPNPWHSFSCDVLKMLNYSATSQ